MNDLLENIQQKNFSTSIVGLGNVGLNLLINLSKKDISTIGIDINLERINLLRDGKSYLSYIDDLEIKNIKKSYFTHLYQDISNSDVICICLPTDAFNKKPSLSLFRDSLDQIFKLAKKNSLIIIESTLPPLFLKEIAQKNFEHDFFIGLAPERINPGKKDEFEQSFTRIFSGINEESKALTKAFYQHIISNLFEVSSMEAAAFTKLYENAYRAINIAFTDEMQTIASKLGININEVILAAQSKGFGFHAHYPSSGIGGACIPMSLEYLSDLGEKLNSPSSFLNEAIKINDNKIVNIARDIIKKDARNVLFLGASYKHNIGDLKRSSTLEVIKNISSFNIQISVCEPFLTSEHFDKGLEIISDFEKINFSQYDVVVLMTKHATFDLEKIKEFKDKIIDPMGLLY